VKVKMIQQMSGPRPDGTDWPAYGAELDVSDAEGKDLCAGGIAIPVAAEARSVEPASPDPRVEVRVVEEPVAPMPPPEPPAPEPPAEVPVRRGPGRPPGSTNRPK